MQKILVISAVSYYNQFIKFYISKVLAYRQSIFKEKSKYEGSEGNGMGKEHCYFDVKVI